MSKASTKKTAVRAPGKHEAINRRFAKELVREAASMTQYETEAPQAHAGAEPLANSPGAWQFFCLDLAQAWWWCRNNNAEIQHGEIIPYETTYSVVLLGPNGHCFHDSVPTFAVEKAKRWLQENSLQPTIPAQEAQAIKRFSAVNQQPKFSPGGHPTEGDPRGYGPCDANGSLGGKTCATDSPPISLLDSRLLAVLKGLSGLGDEIEILENKLQAILVGEGPERASVMAGMMPVGDTGATPPTFRIGTICETIDHLTRRVGKLRHRCSI